MIPKPETKFTITYVSKPKIWLSPDNEIHEIQVKDYLMEVYSLGTMCETLKSVEKVVSMYDASILSDLQKLYSKALRALYELFDVSQEMEIDSKIKTEDMRNYILRFIAFGFYILIIIATIKLHKYAYHAIWIHIITHLICSLNNMLVII